ncbi:hypothetical protein C4D60_Mb03t13300 [Musa balbisiana]|uniref:RING-type E3 ubiquitin transferase n=1 Tax=Musa balbisiana TaxID=52838 RepID=A0A4S8JAR1_MUSBA|nr:hypothetical protein C4D60_Mb03t13300 [Musa balbisiana]
MAETTKDAAAFALVAVAVDKDKSSQAALKWALDNVVTKSQILILIHYLQSPAHSPSDAVQRGIKTTRLLQSMNYFFPSDASAREKMWVNCVDIVLDDTDVTRAVVDFVAQAAIEKLVVGASRSGFIR